MNELELVCARAWPALEEEVVGSWRLRFAAGVTKRANSVLPLGPDRPRETADGDLAARLDAVEGEYRQRGLAPRFQVSRSSWPAGLATSLRRRGYVRSDATLLLRAPLDALSEDGDRPIRLLPEPSSEWFETWWTIDGRGGAAEAEIARAILSRIEPDVAYAELADEHGTAAIGLGVVDGEWLGVFCMGTLPRARRCGYARATLGSLAEWGRGRGARSAYLLVTAANEPARGLYASLGFQPYGGYAYFSMTAA